jgi:hypothetical protein
MPLREARTAMVVDREGSLTLKQKQTGFFLISGCCHETRDTISLGLSHHRGSPAPAPFPSLVFRKASGSMVPLEARPAPSGQLYSMHLVIAKRGWGGIWRG